MKRTADRRQASLMKLKAATLEQRYIQLLEQRIAALEALVAPAPSNNLKVLSQPYVSLAS